jgi:ferredoxin
MKPMKIQHYRQGCIGCNACVQHAPQNWIMNEEDGKVDLKNATQKNEIFTAELDIIDLEANKKACESCPMNIIKVLSS